MNQAKLRTAAIAVTIALTACAQEAAEDVVSTTNALGASRIATVNGTPVPESLFRLYSLNALQKNADELTEDERTLVIDDLIRFHLLAEAAEERGLPEERRVAAELELQRLEHIARMMAVRYLEENPATEAELRATYEANLDQYRGTQYKARHILVDSEAEAQAVIDELEKGGDFAELARERSTGPTGPRGGDLGWFSADSMVEPFANAVRTMETGTHSTTPVQTRFGWHVILVEETREQQAPGLDAVRNEIRTVVDRLKLEGYVEELREAAEVVTE